MVPDPSISYQIIVPSLTISLNIVPNHSRPYKLAASSTSKHNKRSKHIYSSKASKPNKSAMISKHNKRSMPGRHIMPTHANCEFRAT